jgi:DNA-binding GntR family transcriptional regulator
MYLRELARCAGVSEAEVRVVIEDLERDGLVQPILWKATDEQEESS